jgi:hypothetical protein
MFTGHEVIKKPLGFLPIVLIINRVQNTFYSVIGLAAMKGFWCSQLSILTMVGCNVFVVVYISEMQPRLPAKSIDVNKSNDDISSLTVYVAPLLILFGVTKLILYYSYFNISIVSFLEFSEILTSFLSSIVLYVFLLTFLLVIILPLLGKPSIKDNYITLVLSEKDFLPSLNNGLL